MMQEPIMESDSESDDAGDSSFSCNDKGQV